MTQPLMLLLVVLLAGACRAELIVQETFGELSDNWAWEGPPGTIVRIDNGALLIDPREAKHREGGIEGLNLWHRTALEPGNYAIEFDLEPIAPVAGDGGKCNLLFMFDCRYLDPSLDVIEMSKTRTGHYTWLHSEPRGVERYAQLTGVKMPPMRGYSITYYRIDPEGDEPYMMVVRKNPGFRLAGKVQQTPEDQWAFRHRVRIERRGPVMRLFQNDKLVLDVTDELDDGQLHAGGHFGFRSWRTAVKLHGVKVCRLDD